MARVAAFRSRGPLPLSRGATEGAIPRLPVCPIRAAPERPHAFPEAAGLLLPVRAAAAIPLPATNSVPTASTFASGLIRPSQPATVRANDEAACLPADNQVEGEGWRLARPLTQP